MSRAQIVNKNNIIHSPDEPSTLSCRNHHSNTNPNVTSWDLDKSDFDKTPPNWTLSPTSIWRLGWTQVGHQGLSPSSPLRGVFWDLENCRDQRNHDDTDGVIMAVSRGCIFGAIPSFCWKLIGVSNGFMMRSIETLIKIMARGNEHETQRWKCGDKCNVFICIARCLMASNILPTCQVKVSLVSASLAPPWLYFPASETVRLWQKYPFCCPPFSCK